MKRADNSTLSLFAEGDDVSLKKPEASTDSKQERTERNEIGKTRGVVEKPKPKDFFTYEEYLEIMCGNKDSAGYWWSKQMERIEEVERMI